MAFISRALQQKIAALKASPNRYHNFFAGRLETTLFLRLMCITDAGCRRAWERSLKTIQYVDYQYKQAVESGNATKITNAKIWVKNEYPGWRPDDGSKPVL